MNLLSISSNWTTNSDLEKCSTIYKDSDFQDFNEEDLDASNCVQLTRPNSCSDLPQVNEVSIFFWTWYELLIYWHIR